MGVTGEVTRAIETIGAVALAAADVTGAVETPEQQSKTPPDGLAGCGSIPHYRRWHRHCLRAYGRVK